MSSISRAQRARRLAARAAGESAKQSNPGNGHREQPDCGHGEHDARTIDGNECADRYGADRDTTTIDQSNDTHHATEPTVGNLLLCRCQDKVSPSNPCKTRRRMQRQLLTERINDRQQQKGRASQGKTDKREPRLG
jgi:hypothetical protein